MCAIPLKLLHLPRRPCPTKHNDVRLYLLNDVAQVGMNYAAVIWSYDIV